MRGQVHSMKAIKPQFFLIVLLLMSVFVSFYELPLTQAADTLITQYVGHYVNNFPLSRVFPEAGNYYSAFGEAFQIGAENYFLTQAHFAFRRYGSASGHVQARLYAATGTYGVNATAIGDPLAVSDTVSSTVFDGSSATWIQFNFTGVNSVEMIANTVYCAVIIGYNQTLSSTQYIRFMADDDSGNAYAGNLMCYRNGAWSSLGSSDADFKIYGIQEKLTASNEGYVNNENGALSSFSSYWVKTGSISASGYVFSINYGSGYINDTWTAFSDVNNVWANLTKILMGSAAQIGGTILYKTFANASNGLWYESAEKSFVLQASVSFYYNSGGSVERNNTAINNATSTTYTTPTVLKLDALAESLNGFLSWNISNGLSSSIDNSYNYSVVNKTDLFCYFDSFQNYYDAGWADGNASGYAAGYSDGYDAGWIDGNSTGYSAGWAAGNFTGYEAGWAAGNYTGYEAGWISGNFTGYSTGYSIGYDAGYLVGYAEGYAAAPPSGEGGMAEADVAIYVACGSIVSGLIAAILVFFIVRKPC